MTVMRTQDLRRRLRIEIEGDVQGVGFRPFAWRTATGLAIGGFVSNTNRGVLIEAESTDAGITDFLRAIEDDPPPHAVVRGVTVSELSPVGATVFEIRGSIATADARPSIAPDLATCAACVAEMFDPGNRRHRYPFINCTQCGPRYSILRATPYDRANTTMRGFALCEACAAEYGDPHDRRFHAQPNACPICGPQLALWHPDGREAGRQDAALLAAADAVRDGAILALKGLGGFQLVVDARNEDAVARLRTRKRRARKPFAVMFPDIDAAGAVCSLPTAERALLLGAAAPILLVARRCGAGDALAHSVAPHNPRLGIMLPYTGLHHLLMHALRFPVVATSGNLSGECIVFDEREALHRLGGLADLFLVHDRPIARPLDDSVSQMALGREMVLRRARGHVPRPIRIDPPPATLAVGGHLKNCVAAAVGESAILSQHVGDLGSASAASAFAAAVNDVQMLGGARAERVMRDVHPDYASTRFALNCGLPTVAVQHHLAHVMACVAEHRMPLPVLGIAWDGTGAGGDGTVWGGEFLLAAPGGWQRVASFRPFPLPGGEAAVREPRRAALGLLTDLLGDALWERHDLLPVCSFTARERAVIRRMLDRGLNTPRSSSAGRLLDALSSILGLCQCNDFEGEAAIALESAASGLSAPGYPFDIIEGDVLRLDWRPMLVTVLNDVEAGRPVGAIAAAAQTTLCDMAVAVARRVGEQRVALGGGCFQNRRLLEGVVTGLGAAGIEARWPQQVPPNDGGLALGQLRWAVESIGMEAN
ncbi:hydrogenase maturation protein HypF [Constrictibacter sp. MBR-5]|jgi:hydrogenase maturation protein HypF